MGKSLVLSGVTQLFGGLFSTRSAPPTRTPPAKPTPAPPSPPPSPTPSSTKSLALKSLLESHLSVPTSQLILFGPHPPLHLPTLPSTSPPLTVFHVRHAGSEEEDEPEPEDPHAAVKHIYVSAVLTAHVWDTTLVVHGYNWQKRSIWLLNVDNLELSEASLERHLRMVRTLTNRSSVIIAAYSKGDAVSLARRCNLRVVSTTDVGDVLETGEVASLAVLMHREVGEARSGAGGVEEVVGKGEEEEELKEWTFELEVSSLPIKYRKGEFNVVLIGSEGCLGGWVPEHAKKLVQVSDVLRVKIELSVFAEIVEYKYAVTNRAGKIVEWENGWNRVLDPGGESEAIRNVWRKRP